jgi:phenylpropionate dioxygenase-like ring-hydroxylating dioxygenase large terminal subunit
MQRQAMTDQGLGALIRGDAVHRSVYTDPAIFDLEMERIFGRTWVYLGHTSEIREAGDYKTTYIGRHPIVLSRLSDGGVAALLNRCRHRGATVCQHELGNSRFFRCAYHGWTYANSGRLVGVPHPAGYGPSFAREELGLARVPRLGIHRGFIFGSLAADGQSLDEHLGGTKTLIDEFCDVSPTGELEVFPGYQKCAYDGNWKYQVENGVDPYHVQHLHRSTFTEEALKIYSEAKGLVVDMDGHGVTDHRDSGPLPPDGSPSGGFNVVVFPNLVLLRTQIRIIRPISVDRTEIYTNVVRLQNVPEELNIRRLRSQQFEFGPAGVIYADDLEIFERTQAGLQSSAVDWLLFARGLSRERMHGRYLSSVMSDETQHRGMYRHWKQLMTAAHASAGTGERARDGH